MDSVSHFQLLVRTFNWHAPSWDLFIFGFWLVASVLFAFSAGRGRMLTILISTYMAQLLVIQAPFFTNLVSTRLDIGMATLAQLATFVILFLIFFIFLNRYAFQTAVEGRQITALPLVLVFSALQVGLLIQIILNYLPAHIQENFTPLVQLVFLHPNSGFVWLLLPVIFLIVVGRFLGHQAER